MGIINEDINCYSTDIQRKLLTDLSKNELIRNNFFLTGGTALSVFYLHHRVSDDLDFFTASNVDLSSIDEWINHNYKKESTKINSSNYFLSQLINEVRIDFVIDLQSNKHVREKFRFGKDDFIYIDNLENIISNKLFTLVSRSETKDFIDFYFINKFFNFELTVVYEDAKSKDGILEDVPTVAFQIENNIKFISSNKMIFPKILLDFNEKDFYEYYNNLVHRISKLTTL